MPTRQSKTTSIPGPAARLPIYNYPTVPEEAERHRNAKVSPLTRRELKTDFRAVWQIAGKNWGDNIYRQLLCELKLGSVTNFPWYLCVEELAAVKNAPGKTFNPRENWEKVAEQVGKSGIYFYSNSGPDTEVPRAVFDKIMKCFGERFIGFNEGEWDGAYLGRIVVKGVMPLSRNRSRKEACRHYLDWLKNTYDKHQNRILSMSSMGFGPHYAGELGARILGFEASQFLPCDTVRMSFCRGACKQYDLLLNVCPSVFSYKGAHCFKCYPKDGQPQSALLDFWLAGPEHGASVGLLKRLWWLAYMNGANILGLECAYFPSNAVSELDAQGALPFDDPITDRMVMSRFTPLGWLQWEAIQAARKHPMRGVPHTPVALMLPFEHGWHAQPTYYHDKWFPHPYLHDFKNERNLYVWGNIPYNNGDWQIDKFFRWVYPGSNLSFTAPTRDERGIVTPTPFGDSFDVILANADDNAIAKYQALALLGGHNIDGDKALRDRLLSFVKSGGLVIADVGQWKKLPAEAKKLGASRLTRIFSYGKGRLVLVQAPHWDSGARDEATLNSVRAEIGPILQSFSLIETGERPIHSLVNVTDKPDELIITLCNPSQALAWEGTLTVKGAAIRECDEWLAFGEAAVKDGALKCGVPPNDVRVFKIRTEKPFLKLKHTDIPWKRLGYGAPEWETPVDRRFYGPAIEAAIEERRNLDADE